VHYASCCSQHFEGKRQDVHCVSYGVGVTNSRIGDIDLRHVHDLDIESSSEAYVSNRESK
jgi:hypothetical protein